MAADASSSPLDRIDRALGRVEAAVARLPKHDPTLADRHAALKAAMADAVAALDTILEAEG